MAKRRAKKATRKSTRKTTRKKATRKPAARATSGGRISAADTPRTKSEFFRTISESTEIPKKQVEEVFDVIQTMIQKDLSARGPGVLNLGGLMKVTVQKKPATRARKGVNPFTGEEMMFKAKPARKVVKVRPLKALKELV